MLGFTLTEKHVNFIEQANDWKEAIRLAASSLLESGLIKESYVQGMIDSVLTHGPYIVIAPNIAMPHARPEAGSVEIGYSVTLFNKPVSFMEDGSMDAKLFITLSCVEADSHIKMMQEIVTILSDGEKHDAIFRATTKEEIVKIFN